MIVPFSRTNPEVVKAAHVDFIKAGAKIITTNTYQVRKDISSTTLILSQIFFSAPKRCLRNTFPTSPRPRTSPL